MFSSGIITFRETLEAVLVVGIVLTFLSRTNQTKFKKFVWSGVTVGAFLAIMVAVFLRVFFGGLTGETEEMFEGILMFVTAGFLTWMILWVHKQKDVAKKIKDKVAVHAQKGYGLGIFFLILSSVFREGTETALYLQASSLAGAANQFIGGSLGVIGALILGYLLFKWAMKINLSRVFNITSVFLLLFAAGLVAHGVHEFQEIKLLPVMAFDPVINISHILDHKSFVGSFLRVLFGYTSKPTMLELVSYGSYILFIVWLKNITDRILYRPIATKK